MREIVIFLLGAGVALVVRRFAASLARWVRRRSDQRHKVGVSVARSAPPPERVNSRPRRWSRESGARARVRQAAKALARPTEDEMATPSRASKGSSAPFPGRGVPNRPETAWDAVPASQPAASWNGPASEDEAPPARAGVTPQPVVSRPSSTERLSAMPVLPAPEEWAPGEVAPALGEGVEPDRSRSIERAEPPEPRLVIGRSESADVRTEAEVDLVLSPRGTGWVLRAFDLGGSSAVLGPVPLGLAALSVTEAASSLTIATGLRTERVDLSGYATSASLTGRCRLVDGPSRRIGELWGVEARGVVTVVLTHGDLGAGNAALRRAEQLVSAYTTTWIGDVESYLVGLRLDMHEALGLWPTPPSGVTLEIAVAGPGPDGPVWGATAGSWGTGSRLERDVLSFGSQAQQLEVEVEVLM